MQHKHLQFGHGFRVLLGDKHSQAAQMTLRAGETEGGSDNRHQGADQWLYVVSGTGEAFIFNIHVMGYNPENTATRAGTAASPTDFGGVEVALFFRGEAVDSASYGGRPAGPAGNME